MNNIIFKKNFKLTRKETWLCINMSKNDNHNYFRLYKRSSKFFNHQYLIDDVIPRILRVR